MEKYYVVQLKLCAMRRGPNVALGNHEIVVTSTLAAPVKRERTENKRENNSYPSTLSRIFNKAPFLQPPTQEYLMYRLIRLVGITVFKLLQGQTYIATYDHLVVSRFIRTEKMLIYA
jgi:hypothetical protein